MTFWVLLTVNSVTFGGLLFLLSAGFALIFGLMRIPNLTHGSLFMVGAYLGSTLLSGSLGFTTNFWVAAIVSSLAVAVLGALMERLLLRRLAGQQLAQVLVTLGVSFMVADLCLIGWGGDPVSVSTPDGLGGFIRVGTAALPRYRMAVIAIAVVFAIALWLMLERTRLGAMIRAGVDDPQMARVVGIRVSQSFTIVFGLGAGLAAFAGMIGAPILSVYPGLDQDMLPLALVVVILGGTGSLLGSFVGSIVVGFIYNFGQALVPELAYFVLFLPMVLVLMVRPQGLFGGQLAVTARCIALAAAIVALIALPYTTAQLYYVNIASQVLFYAIFALGINVLVGYAGLVSLGHAGLFGVASYAIAYLLSAGFGHAFAIPAAIAITVLATAAFAAVSLRASGIGFIMITLALGEIIWGLAYRWISVTNGDNGINVATRPDPFGLSLASPRAFYDATLVVFLLSIAAAAIFVRSPFGAALAGTRDQPRRMTALGFHVWMIRFWAFMFSGLLTCVSGILFVYYNQFISPQALALPASAEGLLMVISGGAGTLLGPVFGAALVVIIKNVASAYVARWNFLLGAIFVAIVIFMPEGLVPGTVRLIRAAWRSASRRKPSAAAVPATGQQP